jgi:hypothetical protein
MPIWCTLLVHCSTVSPFLFMLSLCNLRTSLRIDMDKPIELSSIPFHTARAGYRFHTPTHWIRTRNRRSDGGGSGNGGLTLNPPIQSTDNWINAGPILRSHGIIFRRLKLSSSRQLILISVYRFEGPNRVGATFADGVHSSLATAKNEGTWTKRK